MSAAPLGAQPHIHTDRPSKVVLPLPKGPDAFSFVILGDRTSGNDAGLEVLAQAVADINLLDPDLVMTVGDLVQGYNTREPWLEQMRQYKAVVEKLRMPWFPVAGNHDVYWRGANPPPGQHEQDYEEHFGPLWYAFTHQRCRFIVLYSDEGEPVSGRKAFDDPSAQKISDAQLAWLEQTLGAARDAEHVFVFLHHPRWLGGGYGDDWQRVHALLKAAGNVSAVFAGHIHRMRYDGVKDGIEYFTLAATGGSLEHDAPRAGYLHEFHVVTVRGKQLSVAAVPVGAVLDPRQITGEISEMADVLCTGVPVRAVAPFVLAPGFAADGVYEVEIDNPVAAPIELTLVPDCRDSRWRFSPDHAHAVVPGGQSRKVAFHVRRAATASSDLALPQMIVRCDLLATGARVAIPERRIDWIVRAPAIGIDADAAARGVLALDGKDDCLRLDDADLQLPDGPLTIEGWFAAETLRGRRAFINKTEECEFGLFVSNGRPEFLLFLGSDYVKAAAPERVLRLREWHHVAGVYDGREVRLYVDGRLVAARPGSGARRRLPLPLYIGADPHADGRPMSFFQGRIDEVRISRSARYTAPFVPERRWQADPDCVLLLHLDHDLGPWAADASATGRHPQRLGGAAHVLENGASAR